MGSLADGGASGPALHGASATAADGHSSQGLLLPERTPVIGQPLKVPASWWEAVTAARMGPGWEGKEERSLSSLGRHGAGAYRPCSFSLNLAGGSKEQWLRAQSQTDYSYLSRSNLISCHQCSITVS